MSLQSLTTLHTVEVQVQTTTVGAALGLNRSWAAAVNRLCRVVPQTAQEIMEFRKRGFEVTHKLYFSTDPQVNEKNRFLFNGRVLEFVSLYDAHHLNRLWVVLVNEQTTDPDNTP